eukprot:569318-Rhodomonas_salina.1
MCQIVTSLHVIALHHASLLEGGETLRELSHVCQLSALGRASALEVRTLDRFCNSSLSSSPVKEIFQLVASWELSRSSDPEFWTAESGPSLVDILATSRGYSKMLQTLAEKLTTTRPTKRVQNSELIKATASLNDGTEFLQQGEKLRALLTSTDLSAAKGALQHAAEVSDMVKSCLASDLNATWIGVDAVEGLMRISAASAQCAQSVEAVKLGLETFLPAFQQVVSENALLPSTSEVPFTFQTWEKWGGHCIQDVCLSVQARSPRDYRSSIFPAKFSSFNDLLSESTSSAEQRSFVLPGLFSKYSVRASTFLQTQQ